MKKMYYLKRIIPLCLLAIGMFLPAVSLAQTKQAMTATGKVIDEDGLPVIGAAVVFGTQGVSTDINGEFSLPNIMPGSVLTFSFVGMVTEEIAFEGTPLQVTMRNDSFSMDEVIVVAFGEQKRAAFTGSAAVVSADAIAKRPVTNVMSALEGQAAGVQMRFADGGSPTGEPSFHIRGIGSINAGNSPLIVLDGMTYEGGWNNINPNDVESVTVLKDAASASLYGSRGASGVILITTKKAKAGDAVISFDAKVGISTRRGDDYDLIDDPKQYVETHYKSLYNYYLAAPQNYDAYNAWKQGNIDLRTDVAGTGGLGYIPFSVPDGELLIGTNGKMNPNATIGTVIQNPATGMKYWLQPDDWYKEAYRTGIRQDYSLSVSGSASTKLQTYASFGYTNEEGIAYRSDLERYTGRLNTSYQAKPWFKLTGSVNVAVSNYQEPTSNVFNSLRTQAPLFPVYIRDEHGNILTDANGKVYDYGDGEVLGIRRSYNATHNYLDENRLNQNQYRETTIGAQAAAIINFTQDLRLTASVAYNDRERDRTAATNPFYGRDAEQGGKVTRYRYQTETITTQQMLNYKKSFGDHNVDLLLAHEYYKRNYYYLWGSRTSMYSYWDNQELNGAISTLLNDSYSRFYQNEGFLFKGDYDYKGKYYGNFYFRRDASSRFHPDHRWGNFFAVGGAWILTNEDWFPKNNWLDMLKFKASFGQVGNDDIGRNIYGETYTVAGADNEISLTINTIKGNSRITWETLSSFNTGFEFELFKGRLKGNIEYYYKKTTDMLSQVNLPGSAGQLSYWANVGDMRNSGIEVELHSDLVRRKDLRVSFNINAAHNSNKITKLDPELRIQNELIDFESGNVVGNGYTSGSQIYAEGKSIYTWRVRKYAGVNEQGAPTWWGINKETGEKEILTSTTSSTHEYLFDAGNSQPKLQGGFGGSVNWKNIDFSFLFAYRLGGKVYDSNYASLMNNPTSTTSGRAFHQDVLNAWSYENPTSDIPLWIWNAQFTNTASDKFLTKADYLKFQNVTLGYSFPRVWTEKIGINNLRLSVTADNIYYWSHRKGMNPERSWSGSLSEDYYPEVFKLIFNLSFKF